MSDYSGYMNFIPCMHRQIVVETSGGRHFNEGEVWDDIEERLVCLDCGEYIAEADVRRFWEKTPLPNQEASHDTD